MKFFHHFHIKILCIDIKAYDGDFETYAEGENEKSYYIDVDKTAWGKTLKFKYLNDNAYHEIYYTTYNGLPRTLTYGETRTHILNRTIPE